MNSNIKIKCFICGEKYKGAMFEDACPVCDWLYTGNEANEDPDKTDSVNKISINQAKRNFRNGFDVWGNSIK